MFSRFKLFRKRTLWLPTWRTLVVFSLLFVGGIWFVISHLFGFLALETPLPDARIVVVEGWISDRGLSEIVSQFNEGKYDVVYTTGVAIGRGGFLAEFGSFAEIAEKSMEKLGLPEEKVISTPSSSEEEHRTFGAAVSLHEMLKEQGKLGNGKPKLKLNLVSEGIHSRRSLLCFQKAFGDDAEIGVYSVEPYGYNPKTWWKTGGGAKHVITEAFGWAFEWAFDSGRD